MIKQPSEIRKPLNLGEKINVILKDPKIDNMSKTMFSCLGQLMVQQKQILNILDDLNLEKMIGNFSMKEGTAAEPQTIWNGTYLEQIGQMSVGDKVPGVWIPTDYPLTSCAGPKDGKYGTYYVATINVKEGLNLVCFPDKLITENPRTVRDLPLIKWKVSDR